MAGKKRGTRQRPPAEFVAAGRATAVIKWSGWWRHYIEENWEGSATKACRELFGLTDSGHVRYGAQGIKWMYTENNALPGEETFADLSKATGVTAEDVLNSDYPTFTRSESNQSKGQRAAMAAKKSETAPIFKIDNEDVPHPDIAFNASEEHDGYYDIEIVATLPLAGVLAILAMFEESR